MYQGRIHTSREQGLGICLVDLECQATFFEQVVLPLVKQRNPDARRQAVTNLGELTALGESLRGAMLRQALKGYTG